jgi:hypothetical protein
MDPSTSPALRHTTAPTHWRKVFGGDEDGLKRAGYEVYLPDALYVDDPSWASASVFSFDETLASLDVAPLVLFSTAEEDNHPELIDTGD